MLNLSEININIYLFTVILAQLAIIIDQIHIFSKWFFALTSSSYRSYY